MTKKQINEAECLTTREAAILARVTLRTMQLWCNSGVLPYRTTQGGHRRILRADVLAHVETRTHLAKVKKSGLQRLSPDDIFALQQRLNLDDDGEASFIDVVHHVQVALAEKNGLTLAEVSHG